MAMIPTSDILKQKILAQHSWKDAVGVIKETMSLENDEGGYMISADLSKRLTENMLKAIQKLELDKEYLYGNGSLTVPTRIINHPEAHAENPPENPLRKDARLIQILRGVKAGTIPVEDAALEIIEGRGLGQVSQFFDSTAYNLIKTYTANEKRTLIGLPVIESIEAQQPFLTNFALSTPIDLKHYRNINFTISGSGL